MSIEALEQEFNLQDTSKREDVIHGVNVQMQNPMADENLLSYSALTPPEDIFARDFYNAAKDPHNKALASIYGASFVSKPAVVFSEDNIQHGIISLDHSISEYQHLSSELSSNVDSILLRTFIYDAASSVGQNKSEMHFPNNGEEFIPVISLEDQRNDLSKEMFGKDTNSQLIKGALSEESWQQFILHHEYSHSASFGEYKDEYGVKPDYSYDEYGLYLEENRADTHAALMMIKQGADVEILDSLTAWRTLNAVYGEDAHHFTGHSLQGIKNELTEDDICSMSVEEITQYAKGAVPKHAMSVEEYKKFTQMIKGGKVNTTSMGDSEHTLSFRENIEFSRNAMFNKPSSTVTPLEAEKIVEGSVGSDYVREITFLEDFYIPMKDVYVVARDFENGLTKHPVAEELYRNQFRKDVSNDLWDENTELDLDFIDWDR